MTRDELKAILLSIQARLQQTTPQPGQACIFSDSPACDASTCDTAPNEPCDVTTFYGVGEEG